MNTFDKLREVNISRRVDKMDISETFRFTTPALLREFATACEAPDADGTATVRAMVTCKVYCTRTSGMYGYQFMAAIWVSTPDAWYQASGRLTGGCGYDKVSEAIDDALEQMGAFAQWPDLPRCGGRGVERALELLAEVTRRVTGQPAARIN
jgi:hypothetical protein